MRIYTIYKATNKFNNKHYIGFDSNFPNRISAHKSNYQKTDFKFYRAIRKYGWDSFEWEIVYQSKDRNHTLTEMEPHFIREYDSCCNGYNSTIGGQGTFGYKRPEKDNKKISKRISKRNTGRHWFNNGIENKFCETAPDESWKRGRLNQKPTTKGKKIYNNGIQQIATNNPPEGWVAGMLPKQPVSLETRERMSKSRKGKKPWNTGKPAPQLYKKIMTPHGEFESVSAAAIFYNKSVGAISTWLLKNPDQFYIIKKNLKR